jgi:sulfide:quinone oxidoreductase
VHSLTHTTGEVGLAGHWIKQLLHHVFIYKAKAKPGWWLTSAPAKLARRAPR